MTTPHTTMKRMLDDLFPGTPGPLRTPPTLADRDKQTISDGLQDLAETMGGWDAAMKYLWAEYGDSLVETMPADTRESIGTDAVEAAADDEGHRWEHRSEAM